MKQKETKWHKLVEWACDMMFDWLCLSVTSSLSVCLSVFACPYLPFYQCLVFLSDVCLAVCFFVYLIFTCLSVFLFSLVCLSSVCFYSMCLSVCSWMPVCVCLCLCACACLRACVQARACLCLCVHISVPVCLCPRACLHACVRACVRACVSSSFVFLCSPFLLSRSEHLHSVF